MENRGADEANVSNDEKMEAQEIEDDRCAGVCGRNLVSQERCKGTGEV